MGFHIICDKCKKELGELTWYLENDNYDLKIEIDNIGEKYNIVDCWKYQDGTAPIPNRLILCDTCYTETFSCKNLIKKEK
ncbi:MAG: hypothetical protein ACFFDN_45795 [Candidatus Hodarchaeota archaeon]